jgi:hypothetical protein
VPDPGPIAFRLGDIVRLRRAHACGGASWRVDRLGADLGLRCTTCGRRLLLARIEVERRLAGFEARGDEPRDAVGPDDGTLGTTDRPASPGPGR